MRDVIIACDFPNKTELMSFLKHFKDEKPFLKIGMELFYGEGPELVKEIKKQGFKVFLDLKLHDIPNTVYKAMKNIATLNVDMVNVHAAGSKKMMAAAIKGLEEGAPNGRPLCIAVTQLTSTSETVLQEELLINSSMDETVRTYAANAKEAGLDGIVCSPLEAYLSRELDIVTVTPGIRFQSDSTDDQVRVTTPKKAKEMGSSFIVVGRSITASSDPLAAYNKCVEEFCA